MDIAAGRADSAETLIFINYRRSDAASTAALLHLVLSNRFGAESVFLDYESIPLGRAFEPELLNRLRSCAVLLVVVGNRWLDGEIGERPIDNPDDWVRREIREALKHGIPVVPVLVGGAKLVLERLPTDLAVLTSRQYFDIRDRRQRMDIGNLSDYLVRQIPRLRDHAGLTVRRRWRRFVRIASVVMLTAAALDLPTVLAAPAGQNLSCEEPQPAEGPILDKYLEELTSEAPALGCPLQPVTATPDGRGLSAVFEATDRRYSAWIYWSQDTGAHVVHGEIGEKWAALDSQAGQLGFPEGDELPNRDGVGRRQKFEGGSLYWHPTESGGAAYPISGEFFVTWGKIDYEMGPLRYPISDVLPNSDGVGRHQDFGNGTIVSHSTRSKGAHAVIEKIYLKWQRHGGEAGVYGYPIADEVKDGRTFRQVFEQGEIVWDGAIQDYR